MRHGRQIEQLMREALDSLIPDPALQHRHEVRQVLDLAEERGAYPILARMLQGFGHYRLSDCAPGELTQIHAALGQCMEAGHCSTYGHTKAAPSVAHIKD